MNKLDVIKSIAALEPRAGSIVVVTTKDGHLDDVQGLQDILPSGVNVLVMQEGMDIRVASEETMLDLGFVRARGDVQLSVECGGKQMCIPWFSTTADAIWAARFVYSMMGNDVTFIRMFYSRDHGCEMVEKDLLKQFREEPK